MTISVRVPDVIAIDGPAASGKSSVARALARRLGFAYVSSGAFYRAITWHVLQRGIDPANSEGIVATLERARIVCDLRDEESRILIDDIDPVDFLRDAHVNAAVSLVSSVARVRKMIGDKMHSYARDGDVVVEGRDIGSVVFPDTPFKFYIDASPDVRARRRAAQGERDHIALRDRFDSSRETAPLIVAADAEFIDSSRLGINEVVSKILRRLGARGLDAARHFLSREGE